MVAMEMTKNDERSQARVDLDRIGLALRDYRKDQRMSGTDVAKAVGISQSTISQLENGVGSLTSLTKVLDYFEIGMFDLVEWHRTHLGDT